MLVITPPARRRQASLFLSLSHIKWQIKWHTLLFTIFVVSSSSSSSVNSSAVLIFSSNAMQYEWNECCYGTQFSTHCPFFSFFPFNKHSSYNCRRSAFSSSSWLITESSACCLQWAEVFVSWREKKSIQGIATVSQKKKVATAIKNKNKRDDNNSTAGHH